MSVLKLVNYFLNQHDLPASEIISLSRGENPRINYKLMQRACDAERYFSRSVWMKFRKYPFRYAVTDET